MPLVIVLILNSHPVTWCLAILVVGGEYLNYKKYLERLRWSRETQKVEQATAKEMFSETWRAKFDDQFNILQGLVDQMEAEKDRYPTDRDELETIIENIDRIEDLVHRLEGSSESKPAEVFPINAFIERTIKSLRTQDRYDGVTISFEPAPGRPRVEAHPARLQQILANLLNNAADAVRDNEPQSKTIKVSAQSTGDNLVIRVADQGGGIPEEFLAKIFEERFTTKVDGHGFGLAACRQIVDEYSWSLTAQNQDEGAELLLELPKAA